MAQSDFRNQIAPHRAPPLRFTPAPRTPPLQESTSTPPPSAAPPPPPCPSRTTSQLPLPRPSHLRRATSCHPPEHGGGPDSPRSAGQQQQHQPHRRYSTTRQTLPVRPTADLPARALPGSHCAPLAPSGPPCGPQRQSTVFQAASAPTTPEDTAGCWWSKRGRGGGGRASRQAQQTGGLSGQASIHSRTPGYAGRQQRRQTGDVAARRQAATATHIPTATATAYTQQHGGSGGGGGSSGSKAAAGQQQRWR